MISEPMKQPDQPLDLTCGFEMIDPACNDLAQILGRQFVGDSQWLHTQPGKLAVDRPEG